MAIFTDVPSPAVGTSGTGPGRPADKMTKSHLARDAPPAVISAWDGGIFQESWQPAYRRSLPSMRYSIPPVISISLDTAARPIRSGSATLVPGKGAKPRFAVNIIGRS